MEQTLRSECARLGIALTDAQVQQFCRFGQALIEKNKVMNLTAITEPQAVDFHGKSVIDVGCGAGFPGVPLKLGEPTIALTLLDSLQKRVVWLRETLESMDVQAQCVAARAEEYDAREQFDFAVSRAVARLNVLAELCLPFVKVGGCFLAMKAAAADEELSEAKRAVKLLGGQWERTEEYEIDGACRRVLIFRKTHPTPKQYPRRFAKIKQQPL